MQNVEPPATPEQTASLFSLLTYGFLDEVVALPRRNTTIPAEMLPSLSDYDHAEILLERGVGVSTGGRTLGL